MKATRHPHRRDGITKPETAAGRSLVRTADGPTRRNQQECQRPSLHHECPRRRGQRGSARQLRRVYAFLRRRVPTRDGVEGPSPACTPHVCLCILAAAGWRTPTALPLPTAMKYIQVQGQREGSAMYAARHYVVMIEDDTRHSKGLGRVRGIKGVGNPKRSPSWISVQI